VREKESATMKAARSSFADRSSNPRLGTCETCRDFLKGNGSRGPRNCGGKGRVPGRAPG